MEDEAGKGLYSVLAWRRTLYLSVLNPQTFVQKRGWQTFCLGTKWILRLFNPALDLSKTSHAESLYMTIP